MIDHWRRRLLIVSVAQFLTTCGFSFSLPFIPFFISERLGVTVESQRSMWVGLFAAAGNLSLFLFSPIWGFVADIYGRRKMVLRANFATALLLPLMIFVPNTGWLVALRFAIGCLAGTVTASQALIAGTTPANKMGLAMGTITAVVGSGHLSGMLLGALVVERFGYAAAFLTSGSLSLTAALLVLFGVSEPFVRKSTLRAKIRDTHFSLPRFGGIWLLLWLMAATGFVTAFERPFVPQLVETVTGGANAKFWVGITLSGSALAGIVAGSVMGRLADRYSPARVGLVSSLLAGLATLPLGFVPGLATLIGFRMGMAFFAAGLDPVFQIWLAKCAPPEKRALFLGWGTSFRALGWFFCSTAGGAVAMVGGVRMVFIVAAALFLALVPLIRRTSSRITPAAAPLP